MLKSDARNKWCPQRVACTAYKAPEQLCWVCKAVYDEVRRIRQNDAVIFDNAVAEAYGRGVEVGRGYK